MLLLSAAAATSAFGQTPGAPFEPQVGQLGKDVVWEPTAHVLVEKMLDLANVTPDDIVYDLGSGDGRMVIAAAKRGARAVGIEYNPDMLGVSKKNAREAGLEDRATFAHGDLFETDLSPATVVTMFLLPEINVRLRPTILDLRPGTRIVSNTFTMGDWEADATETVTAGCTRWCTALLWIVPAKVEGLWKMSEGRELAVTQVFQKLSGTLRNGPNTVPITDGQIKGDEITFQAGGAAYAGRVSGNSIRGTAPSDWSATR
jgi:precorrin-6B methylase 2